jgi:tetratricopeptide (TPR) repeat protein
MAQPINPYVAGAPLREEMGFFGRQDVLGWVAQELRNPATNALVLYGQRRIGKTTLLLQLQRTLPTAAFLPVYFDLQDQATRPLGRVLADLADTAAERAGLKPPDSGAFDHEGHFFEHSFLPRFSRALGEHCRPVFLLDEFDVLDRVAEVALPETAASKTLFRFLRSVMRENLRVAFVFVVGRRAEDLDLNFSSTFKASLVKEIWALDRESAEALVRQSEVNGTLRFTHEAVTRTLGLTSCHPYLTQLVCQRVWERAYARNPIEVPLIDVPSVEAAISDALEVGDQALVWLWNGLSPAEKIYAAALAEVAGEGETISEDQIIRVLTAHATRLRTREVELAPHDLVDRRMLEDVGGQKYRFAVELFRRWVRQHKPLRSVKDELDRVDPLAEWLFGAGQGFFHRRKWEEAIRHFRDALRENPRHFRARLHMGQALLELGQTGQAVEELERAYELDRDEARYALVRALMDQAQALEKAADYDGALAACKQALEVSPNEREAQDIQAVIWKRRGDAALEQGDLPTALAAYREAKATERITQVEALQRQNRLQVLYKRAESHLLEKEWPQAIKDLEKIAKEAPDYLDAAIKLEEARKQQEISTLYSAAVGFQETGRWEDAIDSFSEIIRWVGIYMDVAHRLAEVQRQQELIRLFKQGENYLREGKWREAIREFELVCAIDPNYRDVQIRLDDAKRQLRLEELHLQGEASFRGKDWPKAVETFEELHEIDPRDSSIITKLEEAKRQAELDKAYREGVKHLQKKRWRRARGALQKVILLDPGYRDAAAMFEIARESLARSNQVIEILRDPVWQGVGVMIAIIIAASPLLAQVVRKPVEPTPTPTPEPPELCNGAFENNFECWQHGGELDQSVECDGDGCFAILGNPGYECEGGVPVGEAWIKQSFQVPDTISPTLSLRYRVFSHDLDNYDFFQVSINDDLVFQDGNTEWNVSSCDGEVWDSGERSWELDMSPYIGKRIELSLRNVNGEHEWYNTWTFVDDVEVR